jgi:hypothetical protein
VIFTTNNKENGMYLPPDDRRHFVAWSERVSADFAPGFWHDFWDWYEDGGFSHVGALLRRLDLSRFAPKADPPKTQAFWDIVSANVAPEESGLADVLDWMKRPAAVTVEQILTQPNLPAELFDWLREPKNRRTMSKHLRGCGYHVTRNPDSEQGLWRINGKRQKIYVRKDLSAEDRIKAVRRLVDGK